MFHSEVGVFGSWNMFQMEDGVCQGTDLNIIICTVHIQYKQP